MNEWHARIPIIIGVSCAIIGCHRERRIKRVARLGYNSTSEAKAGSTAVRETGLNSTAETKTGSNATRGTGRECRSSCGLSDCWRLSKCWPSCRLIDRGPLRVRRWRWQIASPASSSAIITPSASPSSIRAPDSNLNLNNWYDHSTE